MSTKLYAGLRVKDPTADLFAVVSTVAREVNAEFKKARLEIVANVCAQIIDFSSEARANQEISGTSALLFEAETFWRARQNALGHHHTLNDPLRFNIVFGRTSSGSILAYPYFAGAAYTQALERTGLFEDYSYQNNADRPDDVTASAWKRRKTDWDELIDERDTFGSLPSWELGNSIDRVFSLSLLDEDVWRSLNELVTPDERLSRKLEQLLVNRIMSGQVADKNPMVQIMSASRQARDLVHSFKNSPEWAAAERPAPMPALSTSFEKIAPIDVPLSLVDAALTSTTPTPL